jgi:hypothetical protein
MAVQAKVLLVRNQLERLLYFATCHSTSNRLKVCIGHEAEVDNAYVIRQLPEYTGH